MNTIRQHLITMTATTMIATATWAAVDINSVAGAAFASVVVTNRVDDGTPSSLRGAVDAANADGGDFIIDLLPGAPYVIDRLCTNGNLDDNHGGDLDLTSNATVIFRAPAGSIASIVVQCSGERVLHHHGTGQVTVERIRLAGGNLPTAPNGVQNGDREGGDGQSGGAVLSNGTVGLIEAVVEQNSAGDGGAGAPALFLGAGAKGGDGGHAPAIAAMDLITAQDSLITGNRAGDGGDGANGIGAGNAGGEGGIGGGGSLVSNEVLVVRTEVSGNVLGDGGDGGDGISAGAQGGPGGPGGSGGAVQTLQLTTAASTFVGNRAGNGGTGGAGNGAKGGTGGHAGIGGGLHALTAEVTSSTIDANAAGGFGEGGPGSVTGDDGGVGFGGGVALFNGAGSSIVFTTITANSATAAANLHAPAQTTLAATVIGEAQGGGANCSNFMTSLGHNVHDNGGCGIGPNDRVAGPLGLGPLADNGGPTRTRLPDSAGPLVELIAEEACQSLMGMSHSDQRGQPRPYGRCEPGAVELPPAGATRFVPLPPTRVFDTREPGPAEGYVGAGSTRTVRFAGVAGIPPTGVTAVAINVTIDAAGGPGYVSVTPNGAPPPAAGGSATSSLNTVVAGQTVPNMVIVPLGSGGQLDFFAQAGGHLLADVVGYFTPASLATAGRIVALPPARVFDTREPGPSAGKVPAGGTINVRVTGVAGVPASGVSAVVLNLTGTEAAGAGFITGWAGGTDRPLASTLNLESAGHTAANLTILPVGADGTVSFFAQSGAHLLADVTGYVTSEAAPQTSEGLFVPTSPARLFDTRASGGALPAGGTIVVSATATSVPAYASAVVLNLTATEAVAPGYVTGWPPGVERPLASTLNLTRPGETRANAAVLPLAAGGIAFFSQSGTHLLADVSGHLLPDPAVLTS